MIPKGSWRVKFCSQRSSRIVSATYFSNVLIPRKATHQEAGLVHHDLAVDLVSPTGKVAQARTGHRDESRSEPLLETIVQSLEIRQELSVAFNQISELPEKLAPFRTRNLGPGRQSGFAGGDGGVDIGSVGFLDFGDDFAVGGVDRGELKEIKKD